MIRAISLTALALSAAAPALADPARVVGAEASLGATGWTFHVTLEHGDTGWNDYADGWRIETPDGTILGERPLLHPHVEEQPFTRSLSGVAIPDSVTRVVIRARTNVDGWAEDVSSPVSLAR
jgi:hypothetical protein